MSAVQGMKIIASGDACCNSPGTHSKLLIAQETVRVTVVKNSYWMEVEGLKRCLNNLSDHGVEIASLATERRLLASDHCDIKHYHPVMSINYSHENDAVKQLVIVEG